MTAVDGLIEMEDVIPLTRGVFGACVAMVTIIGLERSPAFPLESIALALRSGADSVVSVDAMPAHVNPMRALTVDERGWARLFVGDRPVKQRPVRRQDVPPAWVFNGAIYLFRSSLLFDPVEPSLYGERVQAYVMSAPYGMKCVCLP